MLNLKDLNYNGTIYNKGHKIQYRKAQDRDISKIVNLYQNISIQYNNYKDKLNPESPTSFEHTGGMFLLMDADDIKRELHNPHSFWALFLDEKEQVLASFWIADHNDSLPTSMKNISGTVLYPRELIVSPLWKEKNMGKLIFYTIFRQAQKLGYHHSICDIYKVVAYEVNGQRYKVDLLNKPSYYNLLHIGGNSIGAAPVKEIILESLVVWVESQVVSVEHKESINICEKIILFGGSVREKY